MCGARLRDVDTGFSVYATADKARTFSGCCVQVVQCLECSQLLCQLRCKRVYVARVSRLDKTRRLKQSRHLHGSGGVFCTFFKQCLESFSDLDPLVTGSQQLSPAIGQADHIAVLVQLYGRNGKRVDERHLAHRKSAQRPKRCAATLDGAGTASDQVRVNDRSEQPDSHPWNDRISTQLVLGGEHLCVRVCDAHRHRNEVSIECEPYGVFPHVSVQRYVCQESRHAHSHLNEVGLRGHASNPTFVNGFKEAKVADSREVVGLRRDFVGVAALRPHDTEVLQNAFGGSDVPRLPDDGCRVNQREQRHAAAFLAENDLVAIAANHFDLRRHRLKQPKELRCFVVFTQGVQPRRVDDDRHRPQALDLIRTDDVHCLDERLCLHTSDVFLALWDGAALFQFVEPLLCEVTNNRLKALTQTLVLER